MEGFREYWLLAPASVIGLGYGLGIWSFKSITGDSHVQHSLRTTGLKHLHHWVLSSYLTSLCAPSPLHPTPAPFFYWSLGYQRLFLSQDFSISNSFCLEWASYRSIWLSPLIIQDSAPRALFQARLFLIPLSKAFPQHCHIILCYLYYCHLGGTTRCYIHLLVPPPAPK